jgi:paired amphipathic helix protein Sin3a
MAPTGPAINPLSSGISSHQIHPHLNKPNINQMPNVSMSSMGINNNYNPMTMNSMNSMPQNPNAMKPPTSNAGGKPQNRVLNVRDALSYLDLVKSQFCDQPDIYNQFLDIMKQFKAQT